MKQSLRLLLGSLLIGASMLPARAMETPAAPEAAEQESHTTPASDAAAAASPAEATTAEPEAAQPAVAEAPSAADPAAEAPTAEATAAEHPASGSSEADEHAAPDAPTELAEGRDTHWSASRPPMPFDVMRSVQFLQDQVARGNARAIRVQALLLRRFGRSFVEAPADIWNDPRNARAIALFTFSGGTPDVIETLLKEGRLPEGDRSLFEGALSYVRNDLKTAARKLHNVSVEELEPVLAAQVSLALGQIHQLDDAAQAIEYLSRARLLAPGTLIEEAALRLGTPIVDAKGDHEWADRLARRYFDAFRDSTYVANFESRYVGLVVARAMPDAEAALLAMDEVVGRLPLDRRQRLYLAAARRSLVEGNLGFSAFSADRAIGLGGLQPGDDARATLYRTAASLGVDGQDASRAVLDRIDRSLLIPEDASLLDAAYSVLDLMAKPALMSEAAGTATDASGDSAVLSRARQAIEAASLDMKKTQP